MNEFLKNREQITASTEWLLANGYVSHPISAKDYELKIITESIGNGDLLEMGADGSRVLHNAIIKGVQGRKTGIDLSEVTDDNKADGAEYFKGDMTKTEFEDESFDTIVSQSTVEHDVNIKAFVNEVARLLRDRGTLIVSFDYWPERIDTTGMTLYGLKWNILNDGDVIDLIDECFEIGLKLTGVVDWATQDAVISPQFCSPFPGISYTFGILEFIKQ